MKRRIVLAVCLLGVLGGGVDAAFASVSTNNHQICLVLSDSSNYKQGKYLCIDSPDDVHP